MKILFKNITALNKDEYLELIKYLERFNSVYVMTTA